MRLLIQILLVTIITTTIIVAQGRGNRGDGERRAPRGVITGQVEDATHQQPIEYANIVVRHQRDSSIVTGAVTGKDGKFKVTGVFPGRHTMEVHFLGYESEIRSDIRLGRGTMELDVGMIQLHPKAIETEGSETVAERPPISFQIDKKVIDVSQQFSSVSGTAVDVLENVPSVSVDIDGNVSLRGTGSFNVLIDGRPSILDAQDALQQIPASTIDNIELITNPSARYDPDGVAGIINIVTKKKTLEGVSGIINMNGGRFERYGSDALVNFKTSNFDIMVSADFNRRNSPSESFVENRTTINDTTYFSSSNGSGSRGGTPFGLRAGAEYRLTQKDIFSFGARIGQRESERESNREYDEWIDPGNTDPALFTSIDESFRRGDFYSLNADYEHQFRKKGQKFTAQYSYRAYDGDEEAINELRDIDNVITDGQISTEVGPFNRSHLRLDYIHPTHEKNKFEAGYQIRLSESTDETTLSFYDTLATNYVLAPEFSRSTEYSNDIHSIYSLYGGEAGRFGFQGGLRFEYTNRLVLAADDQQFTIDRWDYFPTIHTSMQLGGGQQLMASYTRRIDRPRGWNLEPFLTWTDAYNVRQGNPDLQPEYIDSYEAGYQTYFGKSLISAEVYYRRTTNKIERIRSVYDENVTLSSYANVGTDYALGNELLVNHDLASWWNVNLMGNIYLYRIEGRLLGDVVDQEDFSWNTRFNNTMKYGENTRIQINGMYNSPRVNAQGRSEGFVTVNAALRQEFLNKTLSATVQLRDLFGTAKREYTSEGTGFYIYSTSSRDAPTVMLTVSYRFNNFREQRSRGGRGEGGGDFDGGEEF